MKKILALVLTAVLAVSVFAACGGGGGTPASSAAPAPEAAPEAAASEAAPAPEAAPEAAPAGGGTMAIIVKSTGNPYNEKEASGFEEAIKELGGSVIIKAPESPTAEAQIAMIEELVDQNVSAIAIAGNDFDALQPALSKAMDAGIKVCSLDSAVNPKSRMVHVNQADTQKIGQTLVEAAFEMCGGEGEFAILSATSQASNQNAWIAVMEETLKDPKYAKLTLVKTAYGDDLRDKSVSETEGLLKSYPNLKCIVAPTTVGIAAAAKVVTDKNLIGTVKITGLGLPSEMAEYIENQACPYMYLWNPIDVGYLAGFTLDALVKGTITGAAGDKYTASRLGNYEVITAGDGGTEVLLGPPFAFTADNIGEWKNVY